MCEREGRVGGRGIKRVADSGNGRGGEREKGGHEKERNRGGTEGVKGEGKERLLHTVCACA